MSNVCPSSPPHLLRHQLIRQGLPVERPREEPLERPGDEPVERPRERE